MIKFDHSVEIISEIVEIWEIQSLYETIAKPTQLDVYKSLEIEAQQVIEWYFIWSI